MLQWYIIDDSQIILVDWFLKRYILKQVWEIYMYIETRLMKIATKVQNCLWIDHVSYKWNVPFAPQHGATVVLLLQWCCRLGGLVSGVGNENHENGNGNGINNRNGAVAGNDNGSGNRDSPLTTTTTTTLPSLGNLALLVTSPPLADAPRSVRLRATRINVSYQSAK